MLRYYLYCRKSSESEDRQVLSIESQMTELRRLAEQLNLSVISVLSESRSAKSPGRPVFDEMVRNIRQGKAEGILCWKLDRLSRNPIDGGQIIWMLQEGVLHHIQTHERGYSPQDNVLVMNIEFGMANQFILDLRKNVKRGLKTKAEKGWLPAAAPLGYLNDRSQEKGRCTIVSDPERFTLVKKLWELMLTGRYSPPRIAQIANEEWGFRTRRGNPLRESTIYQLFANPFYSGWFEYPRASGNWYQGNHEPMVSQGQYDRVQMFLGSKGKERVRKIAFAFTGMIRCGECGAMITAEDKHQVICSRCKLKFSALKRTQCPGCGIEIAAMIQPTILHYVYYRCTKKKKDSHCSQRSVTVKELERQIEEALARIHISARFTAWAIKWLREENEENVRTRKEILVARRNAYDGAQKKLDNLIQLKISPLNLNGELLTDDEYAKKKAALVAERNRLQELLNDSGTAQDQWMRVAEETFDFARHAREWFGQGTLQEKGAILHALGSNLILQDKKLSMTLLEPFRSIRDIHEGFPQSRAGFEPVGNRVVEANLEGVYAPNPLVRRVQDLNL